MANKITKDISIHDDQMHTNKLAKKGVVKAIDNTQKSQVGGSFGPLGAGTLHDDARLAKQKNYEKADYIEQPERTLDDILAGKPEPDPVKKPTMRNHNPEGKTHLGHFASDEVLAAGHNTCASYKGEGKGQ